MLPHVDTSSSSRYISLGYMARRRLAGEESAEACSVYIVHASLLPTALDVTSSL